MNGILCYMTKTKMAARETVTFTMQNIVLLEYICTKHNI